MYVSIYLSIRIYIYISCIYIYIVYIYIVYIYIYISCIYIYRVYIYIYMPYTCHIHVIYMSYTCHIWHIYIYIYTIYIYTYCMYIKYIYIYNIIYIIHLFNSTTRKPNCYPIGRRSGWGPILARSRGFIFVGWIASCLLKFNVSVGRTYTFCGEIAFYNDLEVS